MQNDQIRFETEFSLWQDASHPVLRSFHRNVKKEDCDLVCSVSCHEVRVGRTR